MSQPDVLKLSAIFLLFLCFLIPYQELKACDSTLIIAHRGASGIAPENTLSAFQYAIDIGAHYIELDVRKSSDDSLIVIHDATVDATTNGTGNVSSKTYAQLRALDAGSWFGTPFAGEQLPTLYESLLLAKTNKTKVCVEMKQSGIETAVVSLIQQMGMVNDIIIFSFSISELQTIKSLDSGMKICWLDNAVSQAEINSLSAIGGEYVGAGNIPPLADILYAKSQQVDFLTWTVNDPDNMMKLMSKGIKGIITDDPHEMIAVKTYMGIGDGGLMAYWDFDETTGATAFDSSGNNNDIALNGCTRPAGIANNGLAFNGSTDYATVPSSASLDISNAAISISGWVKLDVLPSAMTGSFGPIFDSDQDAYILYLDKANSELRFKVKDDDGDTERPGIPESMLSTGQWIHIAGVYNGDEVMIYRNGQLADHHYNTALDNLSAGQQARLGENGGDFFDGAVDELKIFNRALSPQEVRALYAQKSMYCSGSQDTILDMDNYSLSLMSDTALCDTAQIIYSVSNIPRVAFHFDGLADYVNINKVAGYLQGGSHSFFGWFKTTNLTFDERIFAVNGAGSGNNNKCLFGIYNGKTDIYNGSYFSGSSLVNDGNWHHLGYTWNHANQQLQIWVDGVLDGNFSTNLSVASTDMISIGQEFDGMTISNQYMGEMAELSVWDTVFSGAEILQIMTAPVSPASPAYTNLIAQYNTLSSCKGVFKNSSSYPTDGLICSEPDYDFTSLPGFQSTDYSYQWQGSVSGIFSTTDSAVFLSSSSQIVEFTANNSNGMIWKDAAYVSISPCTFHNLSKEKGETELYPNPTSGKTTIYTSEPGFTYKLVNLSGQEILSGQSLSSHTELDIIQFSAGIYFLFINYNKHNEIFRLQKY